MFQQTMTIYYKHGYSLSALLRLVLAVGNQSWVQDLGATGAFTRDVELGVLVAMKHTSLPIRHLW